MPDEKYHITRTRKSALSPAYWNIEARSHPDIRKLHGTYVPEFWLAYIDQGLYQVGCKQAEWNVSAQYISERLFSDKAYLTKVRKRDAQSSRAVLRFVKDITKQDLSGYSFRTLIQYAQKIQSLWVLYDMVTVPVWYIGGDMYYKKVQEYIDIPDTAFQLLTTPSEGTRTNQFDFSLLQAGIHYIKQPKDIQKLSQKLEKEYGWIPFGYDGPTYWDAEYFESRLVDMSKKPLRVLEKQLHVSEALKQREKTRRDKLLKQYCITRKHKKLIQTCFALAVWTDDRKYYHFKLHYQYARVLHALAARFKIEYRQMQYMFTHELRMLATKKSVLLKRARARNQKGMVFAGVNGMVRAYTKPKASRLLHGIKQESKQKQLNGIVGSAGPKKRYQGVVRILLNSNDMQKLQVGEFLVTPMTSPDYISAMKKAVGFVTDEGGVTCHAAIAGREMNKPAIIGTQNATQVLKDGDRVEMDSENGIVKKI